MDKIICLVGESGSGKTTIAKALAEKGYNVVQSYTTRMPRHDNEWGHLFVSEDTYEYMKKYKKLVAYTYYHGNHYWALEEQFKGTSIYIIDPVGVDKLKTCLPITVVYLKTDDHVRYSRLLERERANYKIEEWIDWKIARKIRDSVNSRMKNDKECFKVVKADYVVDNNGHVEQTLDALSKIF